MENLINSRSKLLFLIIYFYRISGVTFGGLSLGKNWNIIKSPFWYHFGWLGFVIYSIPVIYMIYDSLSDTSYSSVNSTVYWVINVAWYLSSISKIWSILLIHHKYGLRIANIFIKHSLTEFTKLKLVKIIWLLHLIIFILIFILQTILFPFVIYITYAFINNILLMPLFYSISFISWIVSTNFSDNIKIIRKNLNHHSIVNSDHLIETKNYILINYKMINKIDHFLTFGFITLAIGSVQNLMSSVYFALFAFKFNFLKQLITFNLVFQIQQLTALFLNCFTNGKVYEETLKLLNDLDNLNINVNDDQLFKALILFKTSVTKSKCGFTIGRFAQWNNLTLLQVINQVIRFIKLI